MLDLVIRGGRVVDGSGEPPRRGDVAILDGRIVAVGHIGTEVARQTVDATGLDVVPGFIDMHAHSDLAVLRDPGHEAKLAQGITLEVLGQDGLSYAPAGERTREEMGLQLAGWHGDLDDIDRRWSSVGEYLDILDEGIPANAAYLVPHGTVRHEVMGAENRPPTDVELMAMSSLVRAALEEGAVGMSAGLTYAPGMYATDAELVTLCRVVAAHGGYYCPHHRGYGVHAMREYESCVGVAQQSGASLHLAHCLLPFPVNRGRATELMDRLDRARGEGVDITMDTYPYTAGCTYLHAFLPSWCVEGGTERTLARLGRRDVRHRLRHDVEQVGSDGWHDMPIDWSTVVLSGVTLPEHEPWIGRSVAAVAAARGADPFDLACDLIADERLSTTCLTVLGNEENNVVTMSQPTHMVGSDAILVGQRPHPRAYGTFPRFLGRYVRDQALLSWERAIHQVTALPARRLGLSDRGMVRAGYAADVVLVDPLHVIDRATYEEPRQFPVGIPWVIVNGVPVIADGSRTDALPGRSVRRSARPGSTPG